MEAALIELGLFAAKTIILVLFILIILIAFFVLLAKGKGKAKEGRLVIKNLNEKYAALTESLQETILSKKQFKKYLKEQKTKQKAREKETQHEKQNNVYVLNFKGDIKASGVDALTEEINAILNVAVPNDEVILKLESAGGVVHGYGLAAAELKRLRAKGLNLTVAIDKVAASGGYLMAVVANKILAAPFAIIGSIGVVVQLPNFNRWLKDKHIDFEQLTAGEFKRTITVFGENTEAGKEKLQQEIEDIHRQFKEIITAHRSQLDISQVATGEYWLGQEALQLKLVDEIKTADDYLLERSKEANLYEIVFETKKSFLSRLSGATSNIWKN